MRKKTNKKQLNSYFRTFSEKSTFVLILPVNLQNMAVSFSFLPFSLSVQLNREFTQGFSSLDHHSHISVVQFSFSC